MTESLIKRVYLLAMLVLLAGTASFPLLAAEPEVVILETGKPVIPQHHGVAVPLEAAHILWRR